MAAIAQTCKSKTKGNNMPKMGVNPEQTKAAKPVPAGWYEVRIKAGQVKLSKSGKGYNYVFDGNVVNNKAEYNDSFVRVQCNNGFNQAKVSNDFTHSLGLTLEQDGSFPGDWKLKDSVEKNPDGTPKDQEKGWDGAQYSGPMLGKVARIELAVDTYEGEERNQVKQMQCKIQDCPTRFPDIKHLTDIRGKKN